MRALLLGLDGVTFDVVDPLLKRGRMPALAGLIARGVRARLRSTCPPISAPAWVTFLTGNGPGRHGVYNFQNPDPRRYTGFAETLVNSSFFRGTTLLDHAARVSGTRVLAYRIPMTFPPWEIPNGVVVSGPPVPDRCKPYVRPASAAAEFGPLSTLSHDELAAVKKALDVNAIDACNRYEVDLLEHTVRRYLAGPMQVMVAFTGIPDALHHGFWAYHDPSSPLHEPNAAAALRTIIERWYVEIDAMIGRILASVDDDTAVIVLSDHGGGPAPHRQVNFNVVLRSKGLLEVAGGGRAAVATGARRVVERARMQMPGRMWLKRHLPERMQRQLRGLRNATGAIAWERTRAFTVPIHFPITGIWVNLAERHPKGVVQPGAEYEQVRDEIIAAVRDVRDPATGTPVVLSARRREEIYAGGQVETAPDVIIETCAGYHGGVEINDVVTDMPAAVLRKVNGSHTNEGIFIAAGGPFRRAVEIGMPNLADVLPTALHVVGSPLPDDLDGRVVADALDAEWLATHPVQTVTSDDAGEGRVRLSDDDEAEMRKFLQGLGYVE